MERVPGAAVGAGPPPDPGVERRALPARAPAPGAARRGLAGLLVATALVGCGGDRAPLHVRTELPPGLRDELEAGFEAAHPDVDLRFSDGSDDRSLAELRSEGGRSFDVWWGASVLSLERAARDGLLQAYRPAWASPGTTAAAPVTPTAVAPVTPTATARETPSATAPVTPTGAAPVTPAATARESTAATARETTAAPEDAATTASEDAATTASDAWHAVLRTPFVVAFDRTVVPIAEAPRDWIDVLHHAWYDGVRVMDPAGTKEGAYFAGAVLVEALRDDDDLVRGFDWLARLDEQVDLYVAGTDELIGALERGDALLAILPMADAERARAERAPWLHYRVPSSGTPALTLGVAIVQGAAHADAARAFVDYLGTTGAATAAKLRTRWDPVAGSVDESVLPPDFELVDRWTAYPLAVDTLIAELPGWIERWEEEVRTR